MPTILILDDETAVRESFSDYFEDRLWKIIQAESAEKALKLLEKNVVDAAIVDVRLPGIDGNEFIKKARLLKQKIAFVVCSGSPEYTIPLDLLDLSCVSNRLFKKPVNNFAQMEEDVLKVMDRLKNNEDKDE
ncbi:MAG: response regulator [Pseudomonadota bacterium]